MLRQICLYCHADIGAVDDGSPETTVSHGLCLACFPRFVRGTGNPFSELLDRFEFPVMVVDRSWTEICLNRAARERYCCAASPAQTHGFGEVFECSHAADPLGCGQSVHCKTCTIRNSILKTWRTGDSLHRIPAYLDMGDLIDQRQVRFLISTERVREMVVLEIEEIVVADDLMLS